MTTLISSMTIAELAQTIYRGVSDVDHTPTRDAILAEIEDWLKEGDLRGFDSVDSLVAEWREYSGTAE